jgi:hypothetical protein
MRRDATDALQLDGVRRQPLDHETRACLRLWDAIFEDAVRTYPGRSSRRWVDSDNTGAGSFLWCCELFGLNPGRVRKALSERPHAPAQSHPEDADPSPEDEC